MGKLRKNGLSALHPKFIEVWEAIARDISPPSLGKILRFLLQLCRDGGEFDRVDVAYIAKPTFPPAC